MASVEAEAVHVEDEQNALSTEVAGAVNETQILRLEETAALAERFNRLVMKILVAATYDNDWIEMDGIACLGSAGAERVASRLGGFRFEEHRAPERHDFNDQHGRGYLWTYVFKVSWNGRECISEGRYGTRDEFLGKTKSGWRDVADINEADIRSAARHVAMGEGIKQLLGIRRLPAAALREAGRSPGGKYEHRKAGGSPEQQKQSGDKGFEIKNWCLEMNGGEEDAALTQFRDLASFDGKDGKRVVPRGGFTSLTGAWLNTAHEKVQKAHEEWTKAVGPKTAPVGKAPE